MLALAGVVVARGVSHRRVASRPGPSRLATLLAAAALCLAMSGCAMTRAETAITSAQRAVATAKYAGAYRLAAYPYWMARAYLVEAKRSDGHAEYWGARRFAVKARAQAVAAVKQAKQAAVRQRLIQARIEGHPVPVKARATQPGMK